MATVTQVIRQTKQPRGGYIKLKDMEELKFIDSANVDIKNENIKPNLIGTVVDSLSRYCLTNDVKDAFDISIKGAYNMDDISRCEKWLDIVNQSNKIDDAMIIHATLLVHYDRVYRSGYIPESFDKPDAQTIQSIRHLIERNLKLMARLGPITETGFTLDGGYTHKVTNGDGDFLTKDTLIDCKVSVKPPNKDATLQILMYYLMGKESNQAMFNNIKYLAIVNPRLNRIYRIEIDKIDKSIIDEVKKDVIGYSL